MGVFWEHMHRLRVRKVIILGSSNRTQIANDEVIKFQDEIYSINRQFLTGNLYLKRNLNEISNFKY
jgi:hypothetical protein